MGGKKMGGGRQEEEEGEADRKKKKQQEEEERKNKTAIGTTVTPSPSPASTVAVNRAAPLNQDEEEGTRFSAKQLADKMRYFTYPAVLWKLARLGWMDQGTAKAMVDNLDEECMDVGRKSRQEFLCRLIDSVWDPECDCPNCVREGKSKKEKVFTWDMFEGAREGAYEVLWETVFELTNDRLQTANRKGELRPLGYDRWEEGRKLQWKKKAKDALKRCMLMNGRMHAAMDAAEGTVVTDGNNEEDELPALQIKVLLKYLVEVFEEEGVYKCMDEALEAVEEGMEKEAFGEPRALTFVRQWHGKTCEEWEAWMAGDKRREKATLAGPTQFAVPDTDDEQDEGDDKVRVRRFIHLTELACFQELVHRGLMTKKKAKAAIETMDRKGYNQEGIKQFILGMMYENCEKAASAEKKPHQRETNLYIVLGDQLFGNEGMDKAMARVDEPETFRAVPRLSILIQYLGVRFDRKVVNQCVDAAMWDLEDAMEEETFGPRQTRMKTMAMRAAALNGKGRRKEGAAKEREGARGGGRRGEAAAGGGRGAGGRGRREESGRKHAG